MVVIGLGLIASFGFCFYAGWFFADMHPIIPFLLLGIGVDDMFVIVKVGRWQIEQILETINWMLYEILSYNYENNLKIEVRIDL